MPYLFAASVLQCDVSKQVPLGYFNLTYCYCCSMKRTARRRSPCRPQLTAPRSALPPMPSRACCAAQMASRTSSQIRAWPFDMATPARLWSVSSTTCSLIWCDNIVYPLSRDKNSGSGFTFFPAGFERSKLLCQQSTYRACSISAGTHCFTPDLQSALKDVCL